MPGGLCITGRALFWQPCCDSTSWPQLTPGSKCVTVALCNICRSLRCVINLPSGLGPPAADATAPNLWLIASQEHAPCQLVFELCRPCTDMLRGSILQQAVECMALDCFKDPSTTLRPGVTQHAASASPRLACCLEREAVSQAAKHLSLQLSLAVAGAPGCPWVPSAVR